MPFLLHFAHGCRKCKILLNMQIKVVRTYFFQTCKYSTKIVVPGPRVLSSQNGSLHRFLVRKRVLKPEIAECCENTIFVEPSSCVPLFLSSRVLRNHYFCRAEFVRTPIFVEPSSCEPLFLWSLHCAWLS